MSSINNINYFVKSPSLDAFVKFRADCGWGRINEIQADKALKNSLYFVSAFDGDNIIGFGRVVGDGALNYYIQDLIVIDDYRNQNIGSTMMEMLISQVKAGKTPGICTVGLMSARGKHGFYEKFSFIYRPNDRFGPGMVMDIE